MEEIFLLQKTIKPAADRLALRASRCSNARPVLLIAEKLHVRTEPAFLSTQEVTHRGGLREISC
jgi:hypothetical protein